jgi:hypothetical protein
LTSRVSSIRRITISKNFVAARLFLKSHSA